ncbi:MAG TPA: zinc-dependent peptidase, partial [Pedobacter sp.]|nr:zinc-dependent peptidase [Pedobacter sp.]
MLPLLLAILIIALITYLLIRNKKIKTPHEAGLVLNHKDLLNNEVGFYQRLSNDDKERFEDMTSDFLQYVNIEGVGTEITDLDKVLIASSAVIPIFGFPEWKYNNLTNVILYPDTFDKDFQFEGENRSIMGMVGEGYMNGQMLLSRAALTSGFSKSAGNQNTAIHEFVHLLDKSDGATDGIPENLLAHEYTLPWLKLMHREMQRISSGKSDINPYALT